MGVMYGYNKLDLIDAFGTDSNTLILGDSHLQKALDPKYFYKARNISQTSEPYVITFLKLKRFFNRHPKVDTVLLGFSYNNLSSYNDYKLSNSRWSHEMFKRYYSLIKYPELSKMVPVDYHGLIKTKFKELCLFPHFKENWEGDYTNFEYSNVKNAERQIRIHFFHNKKQADISKVSLKYLDSIVNFTIKNRIKLFLVSTPLHPSYLKRVPKEFKNAFLKEKSKLAKRGIITLDYSQMQYDDSLFLDSHHLNEYGSSRFSLQLSNDLKNLQ
ncbi:hypothetical protein C7S20_17470 [Christiangramia fulva]|uniref:DUF1574 domain-containing protein n=2 Tax=Christiangramia fulva TaxID=2126553 RepID=A0A2R3Z9I1_9FLAO|nr:hypothetical protein C7S20_17470 [Christiangramia fulva]